MPDIDNADHQAKSSQADLKWSSWWHMVGFYLVALFTHL